MKPAWILLIALPLAGCARSQQPHPMAATPPTPKPAAPSSAIRNPPKFTTVAIVRTTEFHGPVYSYVLRSDGTTVYVKWPSANCWFLDRERGTYKADLTKSDFLRVAGMVEATHFNMLKTAYGRSNEHMSEVQVTVASRDKQTSVVGYGKVFGGLMGKEEASLKLIQQEIDAIGNSAQWVKVNNSEYIPYRSWYASR